MSDLNCSLMLSIARTATGHEGCDVFREGVERAIQPFRFGTKTQNNLRVGDHQSAGSLRASENCGNHIADARKTSPRYRGIQR